MNEAAAVVEKAFDRGVYRQGHQIRFGLLCTDGPLGNSIDWGGGDILYYVQPHLEGALRSAR